MTEPNSYWICQRQSAWKLLNFNYLTVNASTGQLGSMPVYVKPHDVSAFMAPNGYNVSGLPADKGVEIEDVNPYPNEDQFCFPTGYDSKATAHETSYSPHKKFLIFDQCGQETRMIFSTLCPPMCNQEACTAKLVPTYNSREKLLDFKTDQSSPKVPVVSEETSEGSDYHDDTEEINALLYSSSDELGEDEDEISTGRSPSAMDAGFNNLEEGGDLDEVTSFSSSSKKQKLLEGGSCIKLLSLETKAIAKPTPQSYKDESVVNLNSSIGEQAFPNVGCKRMRRHKIHDTLRMLQKLIPGSETKDPLVIIDEAIGYLKSLKAESLYRGESERLSLLTPFI